jgi:hypothetical protein
VINACRIKLDRKAVEFIGGWNIEGEEMTTQFVAETHFRFGNAVSEVKGRVN